MNARIRQDSVTTSVGGTISTVEWTRSNVDGLWRVLDQPARPVAARTLFLHSLFAIVLSPATVAVSFQLKRGYPRFHDYLSFGSTVVEANAAVRTSIEARATCEQFSTIFDHIAR